MPLDNRKFGQTMFNQSSDFLIGELLLKAGLINKEQLDEALKLAGNKHMQIGQMLIMARRITPRDLQAAIDAQSAVRDHVMETNAAIRALKLSCSRGISFHDACQQAPQEQQQSASTNRLGELLTGSNLITAEQLAHAMQRSMATGLPLGRMLVLSGVINETILAVTLETQIRLRDGEITREEAIACLREMSGARPVNQSGTSDSSPGQAAPKPLRKTGIRLGELLVLAGTLSEMDVMNALEVSLVKEKQLGKVLVEHGYITEEYCEMALKLQSMIDSGNLDSQQAADSLKSILSGNMTLIQAVEQVSSATDEGIYIDFQSLVTESQLLNQDEIRAAMELAVSSPRLMAKILVMTGYVDEARAEVILACYDALVKKKISWVDGLNMLTYSWQTLKEEQMSVDELLQQLNLTKQIDTTPTPSLISRLPGSAPTQTAPPAQAPAQASAKPDIGRTTGEIPALSQFEGNLIQSAQAREQPPRTQSVAKRTRTGKTTANVPAINPLLMGNELTRTDTDAAKEQVYLKLSPTKQSIAKQTMSLKGLLTGQEVPVVSSQPDRAVPDEPPAVDESQPDRAVLDEPPTSSPSNGPGPLSTIDTQNDPLSNNSQEQLKLSEEEKRLIEIASSLVARPEDIMAAMKLVIQKEKNLWQKSQGK